MEPMQFAEGAVKEFLLFRGFTASLRSFEAELHSDVSQGFKVSVRARIRSGSSKLSSRCVFAPGAFSHGRIP